MSKEDTAIRSITPKPDEEMIGIILRLKHNPDFKKFQEVMLTGRAGVLSYLSTAPAFSERQCHYIQGRVHELVDLDRLIVNIEKTRDDIEATKRAEEVANV